MTHPLYANVIVEYDARSETGFDDGDSVTTLSPYIGTGDGTPVLGGLNWVETSSVTGGGAAYSNHESTTGAVDIHSLADDLGGVFSIVARMYYANTATKFIWGAAGPFNQSSERVQAAYSSGNAPYCWRRDSGGTQYNDEPDTEPGQASSAVVIISIDSSGDRRVWVDGTEATGSPFSSVGAITGMTKFALMGYYFHSGNSAPASPCEMDLQFWCLMDTELTDAQAQEMTTYVETFDSTPEGAAAIDATVSSTVALATNVTVVGINATVASTVSLGTAVTAGVRIESTVRSIVALSSAAVADLDIGAAATSTVALSSAAVADLDVGVAIGSVVALSTNINALVDTVFRTATITSTVALQTAVAVAPIGDVSVTSEIALSSAVAVAPILTVGQADSVVSLSTNVLIGDIVPIDDNFELEAWYIMTWENQYANNQGPKIGQISVTAINGTSSQVLDLEAATGVPCNNKFVTIVTNVPLWYAFGLATDTVSDTAESGSTRSQYIPANIPVRLIATNTHLVFIGGTTGLVRVNPSSLG